MFYTKYWSRAIANYETLSKSNVISQMLKLLLSSDDPSKVLSTVLDGIGKVFGIDMINIFKCTSDMDGWYYTRINGWKADAKETKANEPTAHRLSFADLSLRWLEKLRNDELVYFHIEEISDDEKKVLQYRGIRSATIIPISYNKVLWAIVAFYNFQDVPKHSDLDLELLSSASICIVDSILHYQALVKVENSEQRIKDALSTAGVGIWDCNLVTKDIFLSDHLKVLYRINEDRNMFNIDEFKTNKYFIDVDAISERYFRLLLEHNHSAELEYRLIIDCELNWFSIKGSVVERLPNGESARAIGVIHNITEKKILDIKLKEALEKAEIASKAKSTFLAHMSHEIRTPINGITGFLSLLSERELDDVSQDYLRIIQNSTDTLLELINSILDISKIETGNMTYEEANASLIDEVEAVSRLFSAAAHTKKIMLQTFIDANIPKIILCDQLKIKQVLSNLLNNALKFTQEYGSIFLEVKVLEKNANIVKIYFAVKDSGIGVDESSLDKIFKPFMQSDNFTSRKYGGTGLGLSIAQDFVKMMGGKIAVESALNKGSKFYFSASFKVVEDSLPIVSTGEKISSIELCNFSIGISSLISSAGYQPIIFESFEDILNADNDKGILLTVSAYYVDQPLIENLEQVKAKFPWLKILLISYPIEKKFSDELNFLGVIIAIRPFSVVKFMRIINEMRAISVDNKHGFGSDGKLSIKGKVLVAEDNEINSKLIKIVLKKYGLDVIVTCNGLEAIKVFDESFDIVLMDVNMPEMDGLTATVKMRAIEKNFTSKTSVPIIALTANAMKEDVQKYMDKGMNGVINKPFVAKDIENILIKYIKKA